MKTLVQQARDLLARYPTTDVHADQARGRMLRLTEAAGDPFSRDHFVPGHFTASAFVLDATQTELALIFHRKLQRWLQPGGHIEAGDASLEGAARREVAEEIGLVELRPVDPWAGRLVDIDIHRIPQRQDEPAHEHFDLRFAFVAQRKIDLRPASEVVTARWVPLAEIGGVGVDESVSRAVARLRARSS